MHDQPCGAFSSADHSFNELIQFKHTRKSLNQPGVQPGKRSHASNKDPISRTQTHRPSTATFPSCSSFSSLPTPTPTFHTPPGTITCIKKYSNTQQAVHETAGVCVRVLGYPHHCSDQLGIRYPPTQVARLIDSRPAPVRPLAF